MLRLVIVLLLCVAAMPASARKRGFSHFRSSHPESHAPASPAHLGEESGRPMTRRDATYVVFRPRAGAHRETPADAEAPLRLLAPQSTRRADPVPAAEWHCRDGVLVSGFCT